MEDHRKYFTVGKKYLCTANHPRLVIGFDSRGRAVLETNDGKLQTVTIPELWREYKEPVVLTKYAVILKDNRGDHYIAPTLWRSEAEARSYYAGDCALVDIIEIKWAEKV